MGEDSPLSTPLLLLRYENNGTGHDDLIFYFGDSRLPGDSYYLSLDKTIDDGDESPQKTAKVLIRVLEQWLICVETAVDGDTRFLPYDFSDQSTGWVKCSFDKGQVELQPGTSSKEGWAFMPSNISDHVESVDEFEALEDVAPIKVARGLFEMEIMVSIGEAKTGLAAGKYDQPQPRSIATETEGTLDQLQIGERAVVIKVDGDTDSIAECRNNGLTNGAEVVLLCFGDSGQQVEYEIAGSSHSLNRETAAAVVVKRIS